MGFDVDFYTEELRRELADGPIGVHEIMWSLHYWLPRASVAERRTIARGVFGRLVGGESVVVVRVERPGVVVGVVAPAAVSDLDFEEIPSGDVYLELAQCGVGDVRASLAAGVVG